MKWEIKWRQEALDDFKRLDGAQKKMVLKAVDKLSENPLPKSEGGYGSPLGNKMGVNLTNLLKIKLRGAGLRIVYRLIRSENGLTIIVVGAREDEDVYKAAEKRIEKEL